MNSITFRQPTGRNYRANTLGFPAFELNFATGCIYEVSWSGWVPADWLFRGSASTSHGWSGRTPRSTASLPNRPGSPWCLSWLGILLLSKSCGGTPCSGTCADIFWGPSSTHSRPCIARPHSRDLRPAKFAWEIVQTFCWARWSQVPGCRYSTQCFCSGSGWGAFILFCSEASSISKYSRYANPTNGEVLLSPESTISGLQAWSWSNSLE